MAEILYGKPVVARIREEIQEQVQAYKAQRIFPRLSIVRVGESKDDIAYENRVIRDCEELGIIAQIMRLPADCTTLELVSLIDELSSNKMVHGIMVFRPLPDHIDYDAVCDAIKPEKDVDCMNPVNLQKLFVGDKSCIVPCTPQAVMEILDHYGYDLRGKNVTIVNRSLVVGKPLMMLMLRKDATVTACHSKTVDLPSITSSSDIFISGIGKPEFFTPEYIPENGTVVDIGINFKDGKMCGDVLFEPASEIAGSITPVPGGVGSVTSIILIKHTIQAVDLNLREMNGEQDA